MARVKLVPFPASLKAEFLASLLVIEVKNFFYGALIGLERIVIARNGIGDALQEAEGGVHVLVTMKWDEGARE
jgi:hypothetical protein